MIMYNKFMGKYSEETKQMLKIESIIIICVISLYITVKMEYIDSVCNFSKDMLTNFKHLQDKSMKAFVEILASNVAVSGEKIDNLLKEEERLLEEIKNMVEKK